MKLTGRLKLLVFATVLSLIWLLIGWPIIWRKPRIPPRIPKALAIEETFTTSGSWQAPAGVNSVTVELWGGGGGGGGGGGSKEGGGGGAGGQYAIKVVSVISLASYNYVVGNGGSGGASADGQPGGDTTFDSTTVVAKGGAGGIRYVGGAAGGQGSTTGGVGDTVYAGGNGADGSGAGSGGGGGGAGSTGTGNNALAQTGGAAKSEYGGAGGDGNTLTNSAGGNGSNYGGGGGGATKNGRGGSGAQGFVRIVYNSSPTFSVVPVDSPDPVEQGNNVTFTATAADTESDNWYLAVCKTDSITAGSPPSCEADQTYCVSSSAVGGGSENSCVWTSSGSGVQNWYAFACDDDATNPICSSSETTNSPITINVAPIYSVAIAPGGTIAYGNVEGGQSKSTIDISETQTATNDGNSTEDLNIKTSNAVNGTSWTVGSTAGANVFVHEFSTNSGGDWTKFTAADSYQTLATGVIVSGTADIDLRITVPTDSDAQQKTITITVQAVAP